MLNVGDMAPDFTVLNQSCKEVSLSQFKGKKVVLYFYPKDDTPGCTTEAIGFTNLSSQFAANNAVVLGVSKDSVDSHAQFCQKYDLTVDLLSDNDMVVINPYGIWQEKTNYGKSYMGIARSTYLIDENGRIQHVWKNVKTADHAEAVLKVVSV